MNIKDMSEWGSSTLHSRDQHSDESSVKPALKTSSAAVGTEKTEPMRMPHAHTGVDNKISSSYAGVNSTSLSNGAVAIRKPGNLAYCYGTFCVHFVLNEFIFLLYFVRFVGIWIC